MKLSDDDVRALIVVAQRWRDDECGDRSGYNDDAIQALAREVLAARAMRDTIRGPSSRLDDPEHYARCLATVSAYDKAREGEES